MKRYIKMLLIFLQLFGYISCKKEIKDASQINTAPNVTYHNTAPTVTAGSDIFLTLPDNETVLNGRVWDLEGNVRDTRWTKISGPNSFTLENRNSVQSKLSNLVRGEYQFELTVSDSMDLYARDTVKVTVGEFPYNSGEIILTNRKWIFPWYSTIEVEQFHNKVPAGASFRIFIQRDTSPGWIEGTPMTDGANASYEYFIENRPDGAGMYDYGSLYIFYYGLDVSDTPDVKIVF